MSVQAKDTKATKRYRTQQKRYHMTRHRKGSSVGAFAHTRYLNIHSVQVRSEEPKTVALCCL
jgi:hypothetical protein